MSRSGWTRAELVPVLCLVVAALVTGAAIGWQSWRQAIPNPSTQPSATSSAVTSSSYAVTFSLDGVLESVDGLTATVHNQIWLGTPQFSDRTLVVPVSGMVSVTNTSSQPNPAAPAVRYVFWAGYAAGTERCAGVATTAPHYCWHQLGMADPFHTGQNHQLEISESRTSALALAELRWSGLAQPEQWAAELLSPDVVLVVTEPTLDRLEQPEFKNSCPTGKVAASAPRTSPATQFRQVLVAATQPLTCADLP